ncbi:MAG: SDR family oxidoreductase [Tunicatimonas sp.]
MKLIIFGATGTVGQHLVAQALEAGHEVTAFTRKRSKLNQQHQQLKITEGDVLNPPQVAQAMREHDAVLCALGAGRKGKVRSLGTQNIIRGMQANGVRRLICQTTLGCGASKDNLNFFWKHVMFGWFLKEAFIDHECQEQLVSESELDWTIVRPAAFTNGPLTQQFRHGFSPSDRSLKLKVSRADVAYFMLQQINSAAYLHKKTGLSY